jgi:hypothetical protein
MKPFDENGAFAPSVDVGGDTLRRLAVKGAGKTILSGGYVLAIQVVATVFLARLLTPRDFGVVTMVTTFSLLLSSFGMNGFTEALIQREQIDRTVTSNLFWIVVAGGLFLASGFVAAGSWLAKFYGEPLVAPISAGLSVSIFLDTVSVMHLALLKRAMRFSAVANNLVVARVGILGARVGSHRAIVVRHDRCVDDVPLDSWTAPERRGHGRNGSVCDVYLWPLQRELLYAQHRQPSRRLALWRASARLLQEGLRSVFAFGEPTCRLHVSGCGLGVEPRHRR